MNISENQLRSIIERAERLDDEKKAIQEDIKELFLEAKLNGFDASIIKKILKQRKMDEAKLEEEAYLLDTYKRALGMLPEEA